MNRSIACKNRNKKNWLVIALLTITNFLSFSYIELKTYQLFHLVILSYFLYVIIANKPSKVKLEHRKFVIAMMFLPMFSLYTCKIFHQQDYLLSIIIYRMHFGWLIYYVLLIKKVPEKIVINAISIIGILFAIITICQQLTYPFAPFGMRTLGTDYTKFINGEVERRFGLYRFLLEGSVYAIYLYFIELSDSVKSWKRILFLFLILISIFAQGSRQFLFSVLFATCFFYYKNNKRLAIFAGLILSLSIIINLTILKNSAFELTSDFEDGRSFSYIYYFNELIKSPLLILFGNGLPHSNAAGNIPIYIDGRQPTISDIGLLGTVYYWGCLYVGCYLLLMFRFLFNKHLDTKYKCMIIAVLIPSWVGTPLWEIQGMISQAILIYLCDLNIYQNKTKKVLFI